MATSYIGPLTQDLIDACINEFKKKETSDKIDKYIVEPIMKKICYYYLLFLLVQVIIIIFLFFCV